MSGICAHLDGRGWFLAGFCCWNTDPWQWLLQLSLCAGSRDRLSLDAQWIRRDKTSATRDFCVPEPRVSSRTPSVHSLRRNVHERFEPTECDSSSCLQHVAVGLPCDVPGAAAPANSRTDRQNLWP